LYEKQWESWECPRRIYVTEDYAMMDFIPLAELFDSQNFLMPNKTLRVLCEGVLYSSFVQSPLEFGKHFIFQMIPRPDLLENGNCYDVKLVAGSGKSFNAHKLILSAASLNLQNLLTTVSWDEQNIIPSLHLNELSESEISKMLQFIYTGNIKDEDWCNYKNVEKLITLAKNFELRGMKWLCYKNLVNKMTLNSFPEIVKLLQKNCVGRNLQATLNQFFMKNQDKLIQTESFRKFSCEDKDAFLYVVLFNGSRDS